MKIPIDYQKYFKDRTIIITGCGRSGTTILGKILGSMEPAYHLFEPAIMKYHIKDTLPAILFEDYLLPIVQGRNLNTNTKEDSYCGNYYQEDKSFIMDLSSRTEAVKHIEQIRPFWIIKTNEISIYAKQDLEMIFPNIHFVHIIRNGNDVINSAIKKGWYIDEYMQNEIIDYTDNDIPYYLNKEDKIFWPKWNQVTRCACIWRTLVDSYPPYMTYESLIAEPNLWAEKLAGEFGLTITDLTRKHIADIKDREQNYPNLIGLIEEPEKEKFINKMQSLRYIDVD